MRMLITSLFVILLSYGCQTTSGGGFVDDDRVSGSSGVLKMGPDTYTISIDDRDQLKAKRVAYKLGTKECTNMNKEFLVRSWRQSHDVFHLIFRCLATDDPELKRPDYKSEPDVRIENVEKAKDNLQK